MGINAEVLLFPVEDEVYIDMAQIYRSSEHIIRVVGNSNKKTTWAWLRMFVKGRPPTYPITTAITGVRG